MKITRLRSTPVTVEASCGQCQYYDATVSPTASRDTPGRCRLQMLPGGGWAEVNPVRDWCGQFEPRQ